MANNLNRLQRLSAKYNVSFQPLYSKKALESGNLQRVHEALIGGQKVNKLGSMTSEQLEHVFQAVACGNKADTSVMVNGNNLVLNGRYHDMLDMFRGVPVKKVLRYLDNAPKTKIYYDICDWLMNDKNRREYLKTVDSKDVWSDYLAIEHYFRTTETRMTIDDLLETWEVMAQELAEQEGVGV